MPRRTKFEASTALEICFWLRRVKYSATWPVDGAMVTLRRSWTVKRPQRFFASIWIGKAVAVEVGADSGEMRGPLHSAPRLALLARDSGRDDASLMSGERGRL